MGKTEMTYELRCDLREILNAVGGVQNCENLRDNLIKANLTEWMIAPPNAKCKINNYLDIYSYFIWTFFSVLRLNETT